MTTEFEDIEIGTVFETSRFEMSIDRIQEFAAVYDPQPMHLDPAVAQTGPFGKLVASGWHTLCVTMKLMVEARPLGDTPLVGAGVDKLSFKKPVLPGDVISVRATVIGKKQSIKSGRGFIMLRVETLDTETSEVVLSQVWTLTLAQSED